MKKLFSFLSIMAMSLLTSCSDSSVVNPTNSDTALNPLNNGGSQRNLIVVMSDIHLGADISYAEINKNIPYLESFLEKIRTSPNIKELVLAGDVFDEWFVPANVNTYQGKDQLDFIQRIARTNKGVIDAFNKVIQEGKIKVVYVPGNHDLGILAANVESILPGIVQVRDNVQGLGTYSPDWLPELAVEHAHRYNFYCAPDPISNRAIAPGSIMPPGYFFTRLATLHVVQNCSSLNDTIPEITQYQSSNPSQSLAYVYWKVWKTLLTTFPIKNKFNEKILITNIDGFTANYSVNDIIPYQLTPGGEIMMNLSKNVQDTWIERQALNKVPVAIPAAQAMANGSKSSESDDQAKIQYFMNTNSNKRIVVFGHTHEPKIIASENHKGLKSVYANTGTWIDHNPLGKIMDFVVITPQQSGSSSSMTYVKLYNFEGGVFTQMAADSLRL